MLVNMNEVLLPAREGGYAVGLFNTVNLEMARGVIAAAEELNSPVIIGTAQILLPYGPLEDLANLLIPMARRASVPVVVHLDHGLQEETCKQALAAGFSSIMYDCSTEEYRVNIEKVRSMAELAHRFGASLEAELGHVGDNEGSAEGADYLARPEQFYTDPEQAKEFLDLTGADALAIAVGTAHGAYQFTPRLDFDRIRRISQMTGAALVLHGGSGLPDESFKKAIASGICKVNIFTDINTAGAAAACKAYRDGGGLTDLLLPAVEAIKQETMKKMCLFGSVDKGN